MKLGAYLIAAALSLSLASPSIAQTRYGVSVTRKASNLYKVDGKGVWVQTRYCYEYVYSEDASLTAYQIVFLDQGAKCDVKRVLQEMDIEVGSYEVAVTHEDDELYSTLDGSFIRTSMCLEIGFGEEAILRVDPYGGGTLVFLDNGRKCQVESVLRQMRL